MADAHLLHARIGRATPNPLFGSRLNPPHRPSGRLAGNPRRGLRDRLARMPRVYGLLFVLLAALWPHGVWLARRLTDGSDEPWGLLALLTVLALLVRARQELVVPTRAALVASGLLATLAAVLTPLVPPILAAAIAMLALAVFVTSALPQRPATPLATLLLLGLPVIASLQFYLGYPLRLATAHAAAPLLALAGIEATPVGAALLWRGQTILVDPPCAGIGMLWAGSWAAALQSYFAGASAHRTLVNSCFAALVVFAANVLRNALLFLPEAGLVPAPALLHPTIGLAAFAAALVPIFAFTHRVSFTFLAVRSTGTQARPRQPGSSRWRTQ